MQPWRECKWDYQLAAFIQQNFSYGSQPEMNIPPPKSVCWFQHSKWKLGDLDHKQLKKFSYKRRGKKSVLPHKHWETLCTISNKSSGSGWKTIQRQREKQNSDCLEDARAPAPCAAALFAPPQGPSPCQAAGERERCKQASRERVKTSHQSHTYSDQFFRRYTHSLHIFFWLFIFFIVSARDRVLDWARAKQVWQTGRRVLQKIPFSRFLPERQQNMLLCMQKTTKVTVKFLCFTCSVKAPLTTHFHVLQL